mmetsp:Transcript_58913/g.140610  ORF Transcript_58913/g.140610 Transcript_58913/m.140610 type:complete len:956 (+) Transcript_58913:165-3032(+)
MEAYCDSQGVALLQRAISTAVNVSTDLSAEVSGNASAAAATAWAAARHVPLVLATTNTSIRAGVSHGSSQALQSLLLSISRSIAMQPNNTNATTMPASMETTSRDELVRSLSLNVGVFVAALLLWSCCCHGPIFREKDEDEDEDRSKLKGEAPKRNYLLYLQVSVYMCITLTVLNAFFLMRHGLLVQVFLRGESVLSTGSDVTFEDIFLMTFLDGTVVLLFSELFQKLIEVPHQGAMQHQLSRTVWLQGLPTHDTLRWWAPFKLNDVEIGRVQHDLVDALNDSLQTHRRAGEVLLRGTSSLALGSLQSLSLSQAPQSHVMAPMRPPGLDLKDTDWRCHLDDGNPYYVNIATGQVQWSPPEELIVAQGRIVDSPFVEEVQVPIVVDAWKRAQDDLREAKEYTATYEAKYQRFSVDLADGTRPVLRRLLTHPAAWWYWRRARYYEQWAEELELTLERIRMDKKMIAGSAFVTLKEPRHRDFLLRHDADEAWWILPPTNALFSFGRPPFASVTLSVRRAPHPHDIQWENLHVSKIRRSFVFWTMSVTLLFFMVVIITVVRISEFVVPVITLVHGELDELESTAVWQAWVPLYVQNSLRVMNTKVFWASLLEQMPSLILLFLNAVMLPAAIDFVIACERTVTHSQAEHARMLVNFFFLFTNTVVVPFCGVASLDELLAMLLKGMEDATVFEPIESVIFASNGYFALKYLMSAALFSNVNQILQISQHLSRWIKRTFVAITQRERDLASEPWPFYWGYWYAWTLSIFSLGITVSVSCPSTLPLTAVFFLVKYGVDKYNLETGVYASGTDIEGTLAFRVVRYLRFIVALWWVAIGACAYAISKFEAFSHHQLLNDIEKHSLWVSGIMFMSVGALTLLLSWWLTARQLANLQHQGQRLVTESAMTPSFWNALGEVLCLVRPLENRVKEDSGGTGTMGDFDASPAHGKERIYNWNGPELLELE